jgi:hypothetical protein
MTTSDSRWRRRSLALAITFAASLPVVPAGAQDQEAAAQLLFKEGRKLMTAGRYEQACSKFEAARKLFTSSGLLLNLADCHERTNRTASAWAEFGDAAYAAASAGRKRDEDEANRRQAALHDKLSLLSIHADGATSDEVIKRDGVPLDRAAWGVGIPVDPGTHVISAEANGRQTWGGSVEVKDPGQTVDVRVPPLEAVPAVAERVAPAAGAPSAEPSMSRSSAALAEPAKAGAVDHARPGNGQRVAGWVLGGAGLGTMGASGVLALVANSRFHSAESEGSASRHADSVHAGELADAATVCLVAGGALAAAGVAVWLTAPKASVEVGLAGPTFVLSGKF